MSRGNTAATVGSIAARLGCKPIQRREENPNGRTEVEGIGKVEGREFLKILVLTSFVSFFTVLQFVPRVYYMRSIAYLFIRILFALSRSYRFSSKQY